MSKIVIPKHQNHSGIFIDLRNSREETIEKINNLYNSGILCFDSPEVLQAIRDYNKDQDKLNSLLYDDIIKVYCPNINTNGYRLIQYLFDNNLSVGTYHLKLIAMIEQIVKSKPKSRL